MVEKAKLTRSAATRKVTAAKATATSTIGTGTARGRKAVATQPQPVRQATVKGRVSITSESSDASAGTVIRKPVAAPAKKPPVKKTVMSTIKGMGSQKKMPVATKAATANAPVGGRVLRKRN
jgi:hypothetical protein